MKLATFLLAGLLAFTGTAMADDGETLNPPSGPVRVETVSDVGPVGSPGARGPGAGMRRGAGKRAIPPQLVKRFDRDGNGHLDPQERRQAIRALRRVARQLAREQQADARAVRQQRRVIRRFDGNGDGVVGPDEMPQRLQRRMRPMDRNGDGWLDDADR
jgi:hypothetical protein